MAFFSVALLICLMCGRTHTDWLQIPQHRHAGADHDDVNTAEQSPSGPARLARLVRAVAAAVTGAARSPRDKTLYLRRLQGAMLLDIKERVEACWPDETKSRTRREAHGHVAFPSSESALLSISFLTFAVFLVKLVLQVIQTYKTKTALVAPVLAAVSRTRAFSDL